jgi:hypothetical protein
MRAVSDFGNQVKLTAPRRSVYVQGGNDRIGDIQEGADGFVARDRQGRELGTFNSLAAASIACWRAAHGQARGAA